MDKKQVTTLRGTWDFTYSTADVLAASERKLAHHQARYEWWEKEMKEAESKLKDKGFEYREEHRSIGANVIIVGDPQLANRVTECRRKMVEHKERIETYESWVRALAGKEKQEPGSTLILKIDDIEFFRL